MRLPIQNCGNLQKYRAEVTDHVEHHMRYFHAVHEPGLFGSNSKAPGPEFLKEYVMLQTPHHCVGDPFIVDMEGGLVGMQWLYMNGTFPIFTVVLHVTTAFRHQSITW